MTPPKPMAPFTEFLFLKCLEHALYSPLVNKEIFSIWS